MSQRKRHFVFTHNNYRDTSLQDSIECRYIAYSKEIAPTNGTPHLQGFISFDNARTLKQVIKLMPGCHVQVMLGSYEQNVTYCSKTDVLIERGERPMTNDNKGRAEKLRWTRNLALAKAGKLDEIDDDIRVRYYNTWKKIRTDYYVTPPNLDGVCGTWIYGEAGVGKSRYCEKQYPGFYIKSRNKWWQSYQYQDIVVLDDLGPNDAKWIADFLKDWADYKAFQAETKGDSMIIRPKEFIVTSQYKIEDLWFDRETIDALNRRFKKIHIGGL